MSIYGNASECKEFVYGHMHNLNGSFIYEEQTAQQAQAPFHVIIDSLQKSDTEARYCRASQVTTYVSSNMSSTYDLDFACFTEKTTVPSQDKIVLEYSLLKNDTECGFIFGHVLPNNVFEIDGLYLGREHTGQGLGKFLLKKLLQLIHRLGYQAIILRAEPSDHKTLSLDQLAKLYKSFGFVIQQNHGSYYNMALVFTPVLIKKLYA